MTNQQSVSHGVNSNKAKTCVENGFFHSGNRCQEFGGIPWYFFVNKFPLDPGTIPGFII